MPLITRALVAAAAIAALTCLGGCVSLPTASSTDAGSSSSTSDTSAKSAKAKKSNLTREQQEAVGAAEDYIATMGFSKKGLIEQLSSDAGSGFSKKDATVAVESMKIDYNKQAVRSAKSYRDTMHFSRKGLIEQLESDAGSQYTHSQAVYGADHS